MSCKSINFPGSKFYQYICGLCYRAGCVNQVIHKHCCLSLYIADDILHFRNVRLRPSFVDYGYGRVQDSRVGPCPCGSSRVRAYYHYIFQFFINYIIQNMGYQIKVVAWNVKKSLDLGNVQIKHDYPVNPCNFYHVCDKLCGYRLAGFCFFVLAAITEIRDDCSYFFRRRAA